jgi:hypothetical protein
MLSFLFFPFLQGMVNIRLLYMRYFEHEAFLKIGQKQYFKVNTNSLDAQDFLRH